MKSIHIKYTLCLAILGLSGHLYAQTNDATSPNNFPNGVNPTKLIPRSGDTLNGNAINSSPGVDQGTYIQVTADTLATNSSNKKKKSRTNKK